MSTTTRPRTARSTSSGRRCCSVSRSSTCPGCRPTRSRWSARASSPSPARARSTPTAPASPPGSPRCRLLHADDQWRLTSGAPGAAELLFTAEAAGQEGNWSNVDRGYIVGVFSDPDLTELAEIEAAAITVWIRINRKASYLDLRWKKGLHVPYGATEAERAAGADALWAALPHSNGRTDFHANKLSTVLYGGQVRCVSFLSTSVRSSARPPTCSPSRSTSSARPASSTRSPR